MCQSAYKPLDFSECFVVETQEGVALSFIPSPFIKESRYRITELSVSTKRGGTNNYDALEIAIAGLGCLTIGKLAQE